MKANLIYVGLIYTALQTPEAFNTKGGSGN
jgi:hypothetical protein